MTYEGRLRRLEGARTVDVAGTPVVTVPNVIDFVTGPDFLHQRLYPRQATLLKTLFCSPELFTDYDRTVLAEWTDGFAIADRSDGTAGYQGTYGIVGDVKDRIDFCLAAGRRWVREVVLVAGRRGSKGFVGAVSAAYILWHHLAVADPQEHYGVARGKQLHVLVFAGQQDQARINQWRDLTQVIAYAPCFAPFIAKMGRDTMWLYSSAQLAAGNVDPGDAAL